MTFWYREQGKKYPMWPHHVYEIHGNKGLGQIYVADHSFGILWAAFYQIDLNNNDFYK